MKPFFTDKEMIHDKIIRLEDDEIISEKEEISESLNSNKQKLIKINNENKNVSFRFQEIQAIEIEKELKNLDCSKTSQESDIPSKIIKDNIDIFMPVVLTEFIESLKLSRFPQFLKSANITPIFKKNDGTDKTNPLDFERSLYKQVPTHFDGILSK